MLDRQYDLTSLQNTINQSNHLAILLSPAASLDSYAAAVSLATGLKKTGRTVSLVTAKQPDPGIVQLLPAITTITTRLSGGDLVMSFPYQEGAIDKVSYHIDDGRFCLVIKPKPGFSPVTREMINFDEAGPEPDHYIVLNLGSLAELDQLYRDHKSRLTADKIIQISTTQTLAGPQQAEVVISDSQAASLCEVVFRVLQGLSIKLDSATASALILGIEAQTAGLSQPNLTADVFAIISACLRAGGTRGAAQPSPTISAPPVKSPVAQSVLQPVTLQPMSATDSASQSPAEPSWVRPVSSA